MEYKIIIDLSEYTPREVMFAQHYFSSHHSIKGFCDQHNAKNKGILVHAIKGKIFGLYIDLIPNQKVINGAHVLKGIQVCDLADLISFIFPEINTQ